MTDNVYVNQQNNEITIIEEKNEVVLSSSGFQGPTGAQGVQGFGYAQLQGTQGVQGLQGNQGTQGVQGTQGIQGTQGTQGVQGTQGLLGTQGTQGVQGLQGVQGTQGTQGTQGAQGVQGLQGTQGTQGVQGLQGLQGLLGTQGTQGVQGTQGLQGTQGVQGLQGTQGTQGIQGVQGPQGTTGTQGAQGRQGTQGIQGVQGPQGTTGTQGTQGVQGPQGTQGIQGPQGTQGIQGVQGTQGIQGLIGEEGIVAQDEPPVNTNVLWLDTDAPASGPATVAVTAPITNSGTSTSANIGIDLSNIMHKYASPWYVKYLSGYYYEPAIGSVITTTTFAKNRVHFVPFFLSSSITIDRIGAECTGAIASTVLRLGIYSSDSDGYPSSLILDAGTIDTSTTGAKQITISQALTPGLYYFASVNQGAAGNPTMRCYSSTSGNNAPLGADSMQTTSYSSSIFQASVGGALPATTSGLSWTALPSPRVQFRVA